MTSASNSVIHSVSNRSDINVNLADETSVCTYPSEWFASSKEKPSCTLICLPALSEEKKTCTTCLIIDSIKTNMQKDFYPIEDAKLLLYLASESFKEKLVDAWTSFGLTIGASQQVVSPKDVVTVRTTAYKGQLIDPNHTEACSDADDKVAGILTAYLIPFRLGNLTQNASAVYKERLAERIISLATTLGLSQFTLAKWQSMDIQTRGWIDDSDYVKAVAAIDMFFHKFKDSKYAKIRISTLTSRFKDCSALNELTWYSSLTTMPLFTAVTFMPTRPLEDCIRRIFKEGNELDNVYSYTPYASTLNLFMVSPYSARINPQVHHFVNMVGACAMDRRALYSNVFDTGSLLSIQNYCMFMSYIILGSTEIGLVMYQNQDDADNWKKVTDEMKEEEDNASESSEGVVEHIRDLRKNINPQKIISYYAQDLHQQTPDFIVKHYMTQWASWTADEDRECLGRTLKATAQAYLKK
ncbi:N protein [Sclerotinia sclerotiorum rhabdovirus 1]|nr:N protein [Sclerotinia sclerotiorum rhabdovirus 1]